ncbi:acyltransferase [Xanthocytophaga agilis]|uniref:Acyltransferase n=1 Tax=Xanthocytophaga agilis TaxID=3048010 RepID=A0AAE3UK48_9BACT|nr:acyltransferase [Xanthocytophaga agilis]MDJ1506358.1 acyltransferase [Xanthocytophaga agilis]
MKEFDKNVEGLRGIAALSVVYLHYMNFDYFINLGYHPDTFLKFIAFGHQSVLIFFILSGYVIGLTNKVSDFSLAFVGTYMKKRLVRLYPIYLIAIGLSLLAVPEIHASVKITIAKIGGNLLFLQYGRFKTLDGNFVLWTLNYEMLYYIIFIGILFFKPNLKKLIVCVFLFCNGIWLYPKVPGLLISYAVGWVFWLIGLYIAWLCPVDIHIKVKNQRVIGFLFLMIATGLFAPGTLFLKAVNLESKLQLKIVNIVDLLYLPVCVLLFIEACQRKVPYKNIVTGLAFAIPVVTCLILIAKGDFLLKEEWIAAGIILLIAMIVFWLPIKGNMLAAMAFTGSISYAIYVLHMPVGFLMQKVDFGLPAPYSFVFKFIVCVGLTIGISILLERVMQPLIKRLFFKPKQSASVSAG